MRRDLEKTATLLSTLVDIQKDEIKKQLKQLREEGQVCSFSGFYTYTVYHYTDGYEISKYVEVYI